METFSLLEFRGMPSVDTHILLDLVRGGLAPDEEEKVFQSPLAISDIVLWEIAKLAQLGRIKFDFQNRKWRAFLSTIAVIPIDPEIAEASTQLDFRSDPADEIIAATSIVRKIPLLTRDRRILSSKLVPFA